MEAPLREKTPSAPDNQPRLPVEVCERIIEHVFVYAYNTLLHANATLSNCALVCRAWRPRAQSVLFEFVVLRDKHALHQFRDLLDNSPQLGTYVHFLQLRAYLHVPYSLAVAFVTVLRGRLPNLRQVDIIEPEVPREAAPEDEKALPTLPIHPYHPSIFTSVSSISTMFLVRVRFPSFGDLARILYTLSRLHALVCNSVSWLVLGLEPVCMARSRSQKSSRKFLPILRELHWYDTDEQGRQRLLSVLGSSLHFMTIKFPNESPAMAVEHRASIKERFVPKPALDHLALPNLDSLWLAFSPLPLPHTDTLKSIADTLTSWTRSADKGNMGRPASRRLLTLRPWNRHDLRREDFVELLRTVGPVVEGALCENDAPGALPEESQNETEKDSRADRSSSLPVVEIIHLGDRLEWEDWWKARMEECFPRLSKLQKLSVLPANSWGDRDADQWKDYEQSPPDRLRVVQVPATPLEQLNEAGWESSTAILPTGEGNVSADLPVMKE